MKRVYVNYQTLGIISEFHHHVHNSSDLQLLEAVDEKIRMYVHDGRIKIAFDFYDKEGHVICSKIFNIFHVPINIYRYTAPENYLKEFERFYKKTWRKGKPIEFIYDEPEKKGLAI